MAAVLVAAHAGCKPAAPEPASAPVAPAPAAAISAEATAEAKAIFAQRCVMCHGTGGHGDGPASASLSPRPQDYTQPAWQRATSDDEIRKVILGGGPAVGKSMMMPANPDLEDKPEVVGGLLAIVRAFGQP